MNCMFKVHISIYYLKSMSIEVVSFPHRLCRLFPMIIQWNTSHFVFNFTDNKRRPVKISQEGNSMPQ